MPENQTLETLVTRRRLLAGAAALTATAALPSALAAGARSSKRAPLPPGPLFTLGVASGDPRPDSVVLWTRLAPDPLHGGGMPDRPVAVTVEVASEPSMRRIVRRGVRFALPELAHSLHVNLTGLRPGREYFYRFRVGGEESAIGRALTAPGRGAAAGELRFAFVSCQDWQNGYYTAYDALGREDLDLVVHLGDYIYEYGPEAKVRAASPASRVHDGPEVGSLESYRNRHAQYRTDPALQAAHALCPWIVTWDDHELENNYAGLIREDDLPPGDPVARRAAAYQAYYEHMPLRDPALPTGPDARIYRRLAWGDLARFNVLDTRQYRTDQPCGDGLKNCAERFDPAATMTGPEQEAWLVRGLRRSPAAWNVVAQQTMFAQFDFNPLPGHADVAGVFNVDQWDGYVAQRTRLTEAMAAEDVSNPVIITGDIHSSWVHDVRLSYDDLASPTVATELVGTSISSDFPAEFLAPVQAALPDNPHTKFFDGISRGYVRCTLTPELWSADFRAVATIDQPTSPVSTLARFVIENGVPGAVRDI